MVHCFSELMAKTQQSSSLRAKRGNPCIGAASGLPRHFVPRKDGSLFEMRSNDEFRDRMIP